MMTPLTTTPARKIKLITTSAWRTSASLFSGLCAMLPPSFCLCDAHSQAFARHDKRTEQRHNSYISARSPHELPCAVTLCPSIPLQFYNRNTYILFIYEDWL